jgi:hypothetical protein
LLINKRIEAAYQANHGFDRPSQFVDLSELECVAEPFFVKRSSFFSFVGE